MGQETGNSVGGLLECSAKEITVAVNTSDRHNETDNKAITLFVHRGSVVVVVHGNAPTRLLRSLTDLRLGLLFSRPFSYLLPPPALASFHAALRVVGFWEISLYQASVLACMHQSARGASGQQRMPSRKKAETQTERSHGVWLPNVRSW